MSPLLLSCGQTQQATWLKKKSVGFTLTLFCLFYYQIGRLWASQDGLHGFCLSRWRTLMDRMLERLSKYARDLRRTVTVEVLRVPGLSAFAKKRLLQEKRWVENVQDKRFKSGKVSRFTLNYPEKTFILATALDRWTFLEVEEQTWNRIGLKYQE